MTLDHFQSTAEVEKDIKELAVKKITNLTIQAKKETTDLYKKQATDLYNDVTGGKKQNNHTLESMEKQMIDIVKNDVNIAEYTIGKTNSIKDDTTKIEYTNKKNDTKTQSTTITLPIEKISKKEGIQKQTKESTPNKTSDENTTINESEILGYTSERESKLAPAHKKMLDNLGADKKEYSENLSICCKELNIPPEMATKMFCSEAGLNPAVKGACGGIFQLLRGTFIGLQAKMSNSTQKKMKQTDSYVSTFSEFRQLPASKQVRWRKEYVQANAKMAGMTTPFESNDPLTLIYALNCGGGYVKNAIEAESISKTGVIISYDGIAISGGAVGGNKGLAQYNKERKKGDLIKQITYKDLQTFANRDV